MKRNLILLLAGFGKQTNKPNNLKKSLVSRKMYQFNYMIPLVYQILLPSFYDWRKRVRFLGLDLQNGYLRPRAFKARKRFFWSTKSPRGWRTQSLNFIAATARLGRRRYNDARTRLGEVVGVGRCHWENWRKQKILSLPLRSCQYV